MTTTISPPPPPPPPTSSRPGPAPRPPTAPRRGGAGRMVLIVFGALFAAASIGWAGLTAIGLMAHEESTSEVSFGAGVRHVVIHSDAGSITVRGSSTDAVTGRRELSRGLATPHYSEVLVGDTLTIRTSCSGPFNTWCSIDYTLDVPRSATVVASSDDGGVHASDLAGDLDLRSDAGGVEVNGASGSLTLRSSGGGVDAAGLSSRSVTATSSAGGVDLAFVAAPEHVVARSSAGGIDIELPEGSPAYHVTASADSGTPDIGVPTDPAATRTIVASSSAGGVDIHTRG